MNEVHAEVVVPVAPARAFSLFTEEVDAWWRSGVRYGGPDVTGHRFEPWAGGRFLELTEVIVAFMPVADGTRVLLRHRGFDAVRSQIGCEVGYAAGWRELLGWYRAATVPSTQEKTCT